MEFLLFVLVVVLFIRQSDVIRRIENLERHGKPKATSTQQESPGMSRANVQREVRGDASMPARAPSILDDIFEDRELPQNREVTPLTTPVPPYVPHTIEATPSLPNPIIEWFSSNTLIKIGAFLFFLGAVWFVSYAITQGWINEFLRIMLGIGTGVALLVVGRWRERVNTDHYLTLTTLGAGVITASVFAGQFLYELLHPFVALVILVSTLAYVVTVSLRTKTEWLSILSAITAFLVPFLIDTSDPDPFFFLLYLLALSVSYLSVVMKTEWRGVTLTVTVGTTLMLGMLYGDNSVDQVLLWAFVMIFSALFYAASTASMLRNGTVMSADILSLGVTLVSFVLFAHKLAFSDGLAVFVAALITAVTGYILYSKEKSEQFVALYSGLSAVLILIATAFTFDGYTLTFIYTLEIGCSLILSMFLRLKTSVTTLTAWCFSLPVLLSLSEFTASEWHTGIWHGPAVTLYALVLATGSVGVYALFRARSGGESFYQGIGSVFTILFWCYAHYTLMLVWNALYNEALANVLTYLSWVTVTTGILLVILLLRMPLSWVTTTLFAYIPALLLSLSSLDSHLWNTTPFHPEAYGLYLMAFFTLVLGAGFVHQGLRTSIPAYTNRGSLWSFLFYLYALVISALFWGALIPEEREAMVVVYITWTLLSYAFVQVSLSVAVPVWWLLGSLLTLLLPAFLSLTSLVSPSWSDSSVHPDAIGLYTLTLILTLIALSLRRSAHTYHGGSAFVLSLMRPLAIVIGGYLIVLVWRIAHAEFISDDVAVSVALFVYTVCGLVCYTLGRVHRHASVRYVGIVLLAGVVLRLLLVDVWNMDILGRIVTFLGVGLLFILTALFEKPFEHTHASDNEKRD